MKPVITFEEYSHEARKFAKYPLVGRNMVYPAIKLAGEAGELADKIGKHWRNTFAATSTTACGALEARNAENESCIDAMGARSINAEQEAAIIKELGDVLWYIDAIAREIGVSLLTIARENVEKLEGRIERGTICGEGDNR
jgi:NTP pyrophosphatase (non-canonical NTP hydrolase)